MIVEVMESARDSAVPVGKVRGLLWGLWWLISLLAVLGLAIVFSDYTASLQYYYDSLQQPTGFAEYPFLLAAPLYLLSCFGAAGFQISCGLLLYLLLLVVFCYCLRHSTIAAVYWLGCCLFCGALCITRLDLLPAVLVLSTAIALGKHPKSAGFVLGLAAAMKIWPVFLASALAGSARKASFWLSLIMVGGGITVAILLSVTFLGVEGTIAPFLYQQERGLEFESVLASPFILGAMLFGGNYQIGFAASKSFEITGPGVAQVVQSASFLLVVVLVVSFLLGLRSFVTGVWHPQLAVSMMLLVTLLVIAVNKVFSAQYVIWILPLVAVLLVHEDSRKTRRIASLTVAVCLLTTVEYPLLFLEIVTQGPLFPLGGAVLLIRNCCWVVLIVMSARYYVHCWKKSPRLCTT